MNIGDSSQPISSKSDQRFVELDLMRFAAAVAVVVYHYKTKYIETLPVDSVVGQWTYEITKFGYLGVDLFFLISGVVIFCSAAGRTGRQFAISRITRLYPTMWVCMTLTALVSLALLGPDSGVTLPQWTANLTILSEYLGFEQLDGVYWTLVVELKFYFMIFALLVAGLLQYERIWLSVWLAMTVTFVLFKQPFFIGWFISPEYSPQFIAGIVFFLIRRDGLRIFHLVVLAFSFVLASRYAYLSVSDFAADVSDADRWIAVVVIAFFYLAFMGLALRRFALPVNSLFLALGGMTYPLYLLHNRIGKEVFDRFENQMAALPLLIVIAFGVLATSLFVHLVVEKRVANRLKFVLMRLL